MRPNPNSSIFSLHSELASMSTGQNILLLMGDIKKSLEYSSSSLFFNEISWAIPKSINFIYYVA